MKSEYPAVTYRRQSIARSLWTLRSFKKSGLSHEEVVKRVNQLKAEMSPAFKYIQIELASGAPESRANFYFELKKDLLRKAETRHSAMAASAGSGVRVAR